MAPLRRLLAAGKLIGVALLLAGIFVFNRGAIGSLLGADAEVKAADVVNPL
jgi:hypothetical protein